MTNLKEIFEKDTCRLEYFYRRLFYKVEYSVLVILLELEYFSRGMSYLFVLEPKKIFAKKLHVQ